MGKSKGIASVVHALARLAIACCLGTLGVGTPAMAQSAAGRVDNPAKRWGPTRPVPADVAAQAKAFSDAADPPALRPLLWRLYVEGERNATLNFERIGLVALSLGKFELAGRAFDAALLRIDTIYADNPEAEKARSLWSSEAVKDFKGEPFERAMAFFYRGLVYAAKNDFQNARAMFKQADYQDTVAAAEKYAGDFALMPYMAGWASYCDGDRRLARDYLQQAVKADKTYTGVSVERPTLVLFEMGRAPFKYNAGTFGEALKYGNYFQQDHAIEEVCNDEDTTVCLARDFIVGADLAFQATTRGGRPVDAILNGKAAFKTDAMEVANAAAAIGTASLGAALQTGDRRIAGVAGLAALASVVASGASASAVPVADVREWEQLSKTMWLGTGEKITNTKVGNVRLEDGAEHLLVRVVNTPKCQLYWGRSLEPVKVTTQDAGPVEPGQHPLDAAFRAALRSGDLLQ